MVSDNAGGDPVSFVAGPDGVAVVFPPCRVGLLVRFIALLNDGAMVIFAMGEPVEFSNKEGAPVSALVPLLTGAVVAFGARFDGAIVRLVLGSGLEV